MYIFPYKSISKFDLAVKKVKVNPRSSFEQILLGLSPQCNIPSPKVIGSLVPKKKIFKGFSPDMSVAATLVMWPRLHKTNFCSPIPLRLHTKFGSDWPCSFWEDVWRVWTTDWRTDDGACLYYKLTHEPKGSGELKTCAMFKKDRYKIVWGDPLKR